jgi:peptide/nickel transport system substrate-binding protein
VSDHGLTRRGVLALAALGLNVPFAARGTPIGEVTCGVHITLAPTWLDPGETAGITTPFMMLYALHDAMMKPIPGQNSAPCLAESWSASEDGLSYDFVVREGALVHNGEPVTADDVRFSFERYRGESYAMMKSRVDTIETPSMGRVRFKLKEPWPDFLAFYGSATGAGWVVPRKYVQKVGDDGFKKAPIGAGPHGTT